jgi:hypothetical protein
VPDGGNTIIQKLSAISIFGVRAAEKHYFRNPNLFNPGTSNGASGFSGLVKRLAEGH